MQLCIHVYIDPAIWTGLKECCNRPNSHEIRDVYDGLAYKVHQHFLDKSPSHISFILNTDGVAIFRSSKYGVWSIWIVINELPKTQR